MKINKKFYHGTSIANFSKILTDGELKQMNGSCATDDFHYAKTYALLESKIGVVLMFKIETEMSLSSWIKYWFNRNIARKLIGWNEIISEWYFEKFECWGFVEDAMEINISNTTLDKIEKYRLVVNNA